MKHLIKMSFGSHVYGTDTPNSDLDFKGVFMSSFEDIILKKDKETIEENTNNSSQKNTKDDIDYTKIELRKFIKDALNGQTYAMDMLFTPRNMYIGKPDPIWDEVIKNRHKLLSKNVEPFIGYCMRQASKYGIKGSRLDALDQVIAILEKNDPKKPISEIQELKDLNNKYVFFYDQKITKSSGEEYTMKYINILEKKYGEHMFVKEVLKSLQKVRDIYGDRSELAKKNSGIDFKAISHAYRCCYELEELVTEGSITFPLRERQKLRKIKAGEIPYIEIQDELPALMERVKNKVENSSLPNKPDYAFWEEFIIRTYKENLK